MATKARQQYFADENSLQKIRREFSIADDIQQKIDSIEEGAQVNVIETVKVNGTPLIPDANKAVNVEVPEVIDNLYTIDSDNALSAKQGKLLYDYIQNIASRGRFLSNWNSATGLPMTNPSESPYPYKSGDYFVVSNVAGLGGTNYRPDGSSYIIGQASTVVETESVDVSDFYFYDGTNWLLLKNSSRSGAVDSALSTTSTNPVENRVITNALNGKQEILIAGNNIQIAQDGKTISATDTTYTAGSGINIDQNNEISNTLPGAIVSATTPSSPTEGMVWYDTNNDVLKTYDGTNWNIVGDDAANINTKTFFLTGTTGAENIASAQEAIDWLMAGKDPLLMYNNRCYTLTKYNSTGESGYYVFATSVDTENVHEIQVWMGQGSQVSYLVGRTGTNYSGRTRTFMVRSGTGATARTQAQSVLNWYLMNDDDISVNKYNPIILSADANGSGQYTYHLTGVGTGVLIFTSLIVTGNAPSDYLLERIQINYSGNNVTSLQRNEYWLGQYSAGSGIVIDQNNQISNSLPFNPANAGTTDDVLTKTASGYEWSAPSGGSTTISVTLTSAGWSSNSQTVSATGVTASNTVIVSPVPTDMDDYTSNKVKCSAQGSGTLTFECDTEPTNDIDVNVVILN